MLKYVEKTDIARRCQADEILPPSLLDAGQMSVQPLILHRKSTAW